MLILILIIMGSTENKALAKRFVKEIFNENKFDKLNEFVTPNIKWHGVAEDIEGFDNFPLYGKLLMLNYTFGN